MPEVIFNGPAGRIEARYHQAKASGAPIAIILHPHPTFGGTMNNPIVHSLYGMFQSRGFSVLRFNFAVLAAARACLTTAQVNCLMQRRRWTGCRPSTRNPKICWIAGISFGAWISMQLADAPPGNFRLHLHCSARKAL